MNDAAGLLSFPVNIAVGMFLVRRSPDVARKVARALAAVIGILFIGVVATGADHSGPTATIHRWLPHALVMLAWEAVPFSVGVGVGRYWGRPLVAAHVLAPLVLLGAIFLASVTGYLGPTNGPGDALTTNRFRVWHYGVCPSIAVVLAALWLHGLRPDRDNST